MRERPLLIRNGHLLTMDEMGEVPVADILVRSGRIAAIGRDLAVTDAEVIDAGDHIVMPGFVDAHRHMWQTQLRGRMGNGTLLDYSAEIRSLLSACYTPEDVHIGILMGYLDALNAGCTTHIDHCHIMNSRDHAEAAVDAFEASGARGVFCFGLFPNPDPDNPGDLERVFSAPERMAETARHIRRNRLSETGRIRFGVALTELEWFPIDYTVDELRLARDLGSHKISVHAGLGKSSQFTRFVHRLNKAQCLADDLHFVHGWGLDDQELRLLADNGCSLAATPETELQMGMGFPVLDRFRKAGGRGSIGIDIVSNNSADMFTQMRLGLQSMRGWHNEMIGRKGLVPDRLELTTLDILRNATIDGARALGLENETGSLTVGKAADILLIRKNDLNMVPVVDAVNAVVLQANPGNIDTVLVNGDIVKRGGQMVRADLKDLIEKLKASSELIHERAKTFDLPKIRESIRMIFPVTRRVALEQKLGGLVFNASSKTLHRVLMNAVIERSKQH